ncbi:MAG: ATP-binding cassette domain-containing protein [Syntrophomonas sp.]|nr:ATP-binding cassette domain-containing protein [Syntrophomonas sp.]
MITKTFDPVVRVSHLSKSYGNITALRDVSLDIYTGEILAIVGDNGAGKSTLIKTLSGAIKADSGYIQVGEQSYHFLSPTKAIRLGISAVYQDLALVDCRDVVCNIFLGREIVKAGLLIDRRKMEKEARRVLNSLQVNIPSLKTPVGLLSGGQRQGVAVARAIIQGGNVIIFDEPTAAMGVQESAKVIRLMQELARTGMAVVVISHNLHHVFEIAQRICVLRQGQIAAVCNTMDYQPNQIVELIMGAAHITRAGMGGQIDAAN